MIGIKTVRRMPVVLLFFLLTTPLAGAQGRQAAGMIAAEGLVETQTLSNTILIVWDAVQRDHFWECYNRELPDCPNGLPNIAQLSEGQIWSLTVTDGATATMSGMAQLLSAYSAETMGIYDNYAYQPLPEGYSLLEKLEAHLGDDAVDTVFVSSKGRFVGSRCQGEVGVDGQVERRGLPWCLVKRQIDQFVPAESAWLANDVVGLRVLDALTEHFTNRPDQALVAFFDFPEPDVSGHLYGENSAEYSLGLVSDDAWLGQIVSRLQAFGAYENTLLYVVTDHGFDEDRSEHDNAPFGILATNDPLVARSGDRKDVTATLLERYGVDPGGAGVIPAIDGYSLYSMPPVACVPAGGAYLDYPGAPACCAGLSLISLSKVVDGMTAIERCVAPSGGEGDGSGYCTACGDGQCTQNENGCNCPQDCGTGEEGPAEGELPPPTACPAGSVEVTLLDEGFESWPPAGWSVVDNGGECVVESTVTWGRPNVTGGSGAAADADSDRCGAGTTMDTELRSPVVDLSGLGNAWLQYRTNYLNFLGEDSANVDISMDGGETWANLLTWNEDHLMPATVDLDATPYVGSAGTVLRWRYRAPSWDWYWQVDDVRLTSCAPAPVGVDLAPEVTQGSGCRGETAEHELWLWNNTGSAGLFSVGYTAGWPTYGPDQVFLQAGESVKLTVSVEIEGTEVDTATVSVEGNGYADQARIETAVSESWELTPPLPTPRGDLAVVASGGSLYAIGGTTSGIAPGNGENERYRPSPEGGGWRSMASMPLPLTLIDGGAIGGTIYIPGGFDGAAFVPTVLAYDTGTDSWSTVAPAPRNVAGYGVAACGGRLYRLGGATEDRWPFGDVGAEVYDPSVDAWTALAEMIYGHIWPAVGCIGGKLYVAGGLDQGWASAAAEVYDVAAGAWSDLAMADLPYSWSAGASFVDEDRLTLVGGLINDQAAAASISYDPAANAWTAGPELEDARFRSGADWLEAGYVAGGWLPMWSPRGTNEALRPCPQCMHVQGIAAKSRRSGGRWVLWAKVAIRTAEQRPVPGALVSARWTLPDGYQQDQYRVANVLGTAVFGLASRQMGTYQICVTDLVAGGYFYDPTQNTETCDSVEVP